MSLFFFLEVWFYFFSLHSLLKLSNHGFFCDQALSICRLVLQLHYFIRLTNSLTENPECSVHEPAAVYPFPFFQGNTEGMTPSFRNLRPLNATRKSVSRKWREHNNFFFGGVAFGPNSEPDFRNPVVKGLLIFWENMESDFFFSILDRVGILDAEITAAVLAFVGVMVFTTWTWWFTSISLLWKCYNRCSIQTCKQWHRSSSSKTMLTHGTGLHEWWQTLCRLWLLMCAILLWPCHGIFKVTCHDEVTFLVSDSQQSVVWASCSMSWFSAWGLSGLYTTHSMIEVISCGSPCGVTSRRRHASPEGTGRFRDWQGKVSLM